MLATRQAGRDRVDGEAIVRRLARTMGDTLETWRLIGPGDRLLAAEVARAREGAAGEFARRR